MSSCEVKDFFQQIWPFFVRKVNKFHYFFYGVLKETRHANKAIRPFSTIELIGYGYIGEQREIRILLTAKINFVLKWTILFNEVGNFRYLSCGVPKNKNHGSRGKCQKLGKIASLSQIRTLSWCNRSF